MRGYQDFPLPFRKRQGSFPGRVIEHKHLLWEMKEFMSL
jgi:hypothetical protein